MSLKRRLKNIFTLAVVAMVIGAATANAAVIFVVDAPNDEDTERGSRPSAGTSWPATVSQTFDLSTKGDSAAGLSGTLYVSGTGWFEPSGPVLTERFNNDYAGDLGNATHTATWTATGYPSGTEVEVYSTWRSRGHYAGSAPYSINGADPITVSMKVPSVGDLVLNDGFKDVNFQFLGIGTADGAGQVQVVLSGESGWAPVDAIALVSEGPDSDGDGMSDSFEMTHTSPPSPTALNPGDDLEPDGLTNLQEYQFGTNPNDSDTDDDTLQDGDEVAGAGSRPPTDPAEPDTDGDTLGDLVETNTGTFVGAADTGTDPTAADTDSDGLDDRVETDAFLAAPDTATHPLMADTDSDGAGDW